MHIIGGQSNAKTDCLSCRPGTAGFRRTEALITLLKRNSLVLCDTIRHSFRDVGGLERDNWLKENWAIVVINTEYGIAKFPRKKSPGAAHH